MVSYTCGGQAQAPEPATEPAAVAPPPPRTFDASASGPSELVEMVISTMQTDAAAARELATRALESAEPREAGRLRWLAARASIAAGDLITADAHRAALAQSDHPLAPWATLLRAESLAEHEPAQATELAATLIADDWAGQVRARRVHALGLLVAGDESALTLLQELVDEAPARTGAASAAMPLADHLAQSEDPEARERALLLYRRIASRGPKARAGIVAAASALTVLATLPDERREALAAIPIEDRFARAEAFYRGMHHQDAERAYAELARDLSEDTGARCRAQLEQGKAMLRRRRRAQGAEHMRAVAEHCQDTDVRAWARYKAGRAYGQTGHAAEAIEQYEALMREAPGHRLADDAMFRAALTDMYAGDIDSMVRRLASLPERFPEGDMVGEGLFRLVLHARAEGDHAAALRWLEQAEGLGEDQEDLRGRAAYWRARTLQSLDREPEAIEIFVNLARRWPLAYYAQQALHRLNEIAPEQAEIVLAAMRGQQSASSLPWHAQMDQPWFSRFVELAAVGEIDLASTELRDADADDELVWVAAAVFERAGALPQVARLVRRRHTGFRSDLPVGAAYSRWRLAYPLAFAPLIEEHAAAQEVPSAFVRAIAREESSFDPNAVSWAHAYGLTQVILPTARRHGRHLDVPINARTLRQPEVNLAVGAHYMRYLRDRFGANPALVPAAYNAGQGAVARWVRERGDLSFDEFVERIPYDETRRYTRRVLQTWGVYAWLDEGRLPDLPARVR